MIGLSWVGLMLAGVALLVFSDGHDGLWRKWLGLGILGLLVLKMLVVVILN